MLNLLHAVTCAPVYLNQTGFYLVTDERLWTKMGCFVRQIILSPVLKDPILASTESVQFTRLISIMLYLYLCV